MRYILERMDEQAIDHLLHAVGSSSRLSQDFLNAKRWNHLPAGWARDSMSGSFLVSIPTFIRDESGDRLYCFCFEGVPYQLTLLGFMGWDAQLTDAISLNEPSATAFHAALKEAFSVHKECVSVRDGKLVALGEAVIPQF